jgi:protein-disulfide isomerase
MSPKALVVVGLLALTSRLSTCRSPGESSGDASQPQTSEKIVEVKGVDSSALSARERTEWSDDVSHLLAPCPDQAVPLAQCVNEARPCRACLPAVRYLLDQVQRGRTRSQVETAYRERFAADQVKNIDLTDTPSRGPAGAPIVIVEFADFECPACGAMRPVLDEVIEAHADKIRFFYKHFPLGMHQNAEKAARAAVAAMHQGKFWEMHHLLFENQQALSTENIEKLAQGVGLDLARFRQDRDSEATADFVAKNRKQGEALNLTGTPSIFINGRRFEHGGEPKQELEDWITLELELQGAPAAPTPASSASAKAPAAAAARTP